MGSRFFLGNHVYIYSLVCVFVQLHTGMAISEGIVFSISGRGLSNIKWGCTSHHQLIVFCVYIYLHRGLRRRRRRLNMFIIYRRCWLFHSILVCVCPSIRQEQSNPPWPYTSTAAPCNIIEWLHSLYETVSRGLQNVPVVCQCVTPPARFCCLESQHEISKTKKTM